MPCNPNTIKLTLFSSAYLMVSSYGFAPQDFFHDLQALPACEFLHFFEYISPLVLEDLETEFVASQSRSFPVHPCVDDVDCVDLGVLRLREIAIELYAATRTLASVTGGIRILSCIPT